MARNPFLERFHTILLFIRQSGVVGSWTHEFSCSKEMKRVGVCESVISRIRSCQRQESFELN